MKKYISAVLLAVMLISSLLLASCGEDLGALESTAVFSVPEHSSRLVVSNVRVRGFTVSWDNLQGEHEYAIAASHNGNISTYEEALEHSHIILDFTPDNILNGTYRVTGLIPGREYEIRLFARRRNTRAAEFLTARATLPFLDAAELVSVWFNGEEAIANSREDTFTKIYMPVLASGENETEYIVTHRTARLSYLFFEDGERVPEEFTMRAGESIILTAVNERTNAARDYLISIRPVDNGIPVVIIETERPIVSRTDYINAHVRLLDSTINPFGIGIFEGEMIIRARGTMSERRPKRSFVIRTPDGSNAQLLDMHANEDWVLLSNFTDKTLLRNYIAHELSRDMGAIFSPRLRFVDLVLNGDYIGTYMLGERIKIDRGRLDLPKIRAEARVREQWGREVIRPASTPEELTGSYILEIRSTSSYSNTEIIFETKRVRWSMGSYFRIRQPGPRNLTLEAVNYISGFVNAAEDALFGDDFKDPEIGYRAYFDVATFIDWYIVNELFKRVDSDFSGGIYFYKPRDGKLSMGPVWDFENAAGNISYAGGYSPEGCHVRNGSWFARLFEDPAFELEFQERWNYIMTSDIFDIMFLRIELAAELLEQSQSMNFTRWPILGVNVWPNDSGATSRRTYQDEVNYLVEWLEARIAWIDAEIN